MKAENNKYNFMDYLLADMEFYVGGVMAGLGLIAFASIYGWPIGLLATPMGGALHLDGRKRKLKMNK